MCAKVLELLTLELSRFRKGTMWAQVPLRVPVGNQEGAGAKPARVVAQVPSAAAVPHRSPQGT